MQPKILMIDDDLFFWENYQKILSKRYEIYTSSNSAKGLELLDKHHPDLLLLDINMHTETEGIQILPIIKNKYPNMPVLIVTNYDSHTIFSKAINNGADDFFVKSDDLKSLTGIIQNLLEPRQEIPETPFIVRSPQMQSIIKRAHKAASALAPVIITGETGSGKEVIARFIHQSSPRQNKPFIALNCGALTDTLLQDTFFGHEKGSFTGAITKSKGSFEQANGGTIFLDELEDLSHKGQTMLLRLLQDKQLQRIGGKGTVSTDVRVIAALKHNLKSLVSKGVFREDLYYRLAVFEIYIPPLRERLEDIIPLIHYYLQHSAAKNKQLTQGAIRLLQSYSWPGNVRELKNAIERAVAMTEWDKLRQSDFAFLLTDDNEKMLPYDVAKHSAFLKFRSQYIKEALLRNEGNITRASEETGLSRQTIQNFLKENKIK